MVFGDANIRDGDIQHGCDNIDGAACPAISGSRSQMRLTTVTRRLFTLGHAVVAQHGGDT
jgi:hypothetical protein